MTNIATETTIKIPHESDTELFLLYEKTKVFDEHGKLIKSDNKLRNELAAKNSKLVTFVVNKLYNKKKEHKKLREDLLQEGAMGLLSAIEGFKPELGFKFSTYGILWIRQRINNYLLTQDPTLKIPSHIRIAQGKVLKKMKDLGLGFKDLVRDNANTFGVTPKMVDSINSAFTSKWIVSLEDPVSGTRGSHMNSGVGPVPTIGSLLEDKAFTRGENSLQRARLVSIVREGLKLLKKREKLILLLRYDIIGENDIPMNENNKEEESNRITEEEETTNE